MTDVIWSRIQEKKAKGQTHIAIDELEKLYEEHELQRFTIDFEKEMKALKDKAKRIDEEIKLQECELIEPYF